MVGIVVVVAAVAAAVVVVAAVAAAVMKLSPAGISSVDKLFYRNKQSYLMYNVDSRLARHNKLRSS